MNQPSLQHQGHALSMVLGSSASFFIALAYNSNLVPNTKYVFLIVGLAYLIGWGVSHVRSFSEHKFFFSLLTYHLVAASFLLAGVYELAPQDTLRNLLMTTLNLLIGSYPLVLFFTIPSAAASSLLLTVVDRFFEGVSHKEAMHMQLAK